MGCDGCTACCRCLIFPINSRMDIEFWRERGATVINGLAIIEKRCANLSCPGGCTIYDTRPKVCRLFKKDSMYCYIARKIMGID